MKFRRNKKNLIFMSNDLTEDDIPCKIDIDTIIVHHLDKKEPDIYSNKANYEIIIKYKDKDVDFKKDINSLYIKDEKCSLDHIVKYLNKKFKKDEDVEYIIIFKDDKLVKILNYMKGV